MILVTLSEDIEAEAEADADAGEEEEEEDEEWYLSSSEDEDQLSDIDLEVDEWDDILSEDEDELSDIDLADKRSQCRVHNVTVNSCLQNWGIENSIVISNSSGLYGPVYREVSIFFKDLEYQNERSI
ncbi:hypothetical protein TSUD_142610 [Trifolium subterraneum]|uniref:Uncharacterized protein n=1 Tax=Trifolium subterraneum TaxID=3900 RepID=A0A2Z6MHJ1_TRISU|nr:hypothetical protein TSUD_142610 [Trifolium subterraneum]